jgi:PAS domain S-box-containing protein
MVAKEAIELKPAKSGIRLFLARFLHWLLEPTAGAVEKDRQKLRLLSGFLLVITVSGIIGAAVRQGLGIGTWFNLLAITAIFAVAYGLSRTRYFKPALILALLAPALNVIGILVIGSDSTGIILSLAWLVLPFLLASIFLSRRATLFVAIGYFVFMVSIFPFTTLATEAIGEVIAFSLIVVFLVIAISVVRQRDQSRVEKELNRRTEAEEEIQAEKNKLESLIGAMDCTLTIQDKDFNIIYQNEASKLASGGDHIGEKCYRVYEGRKTVGDGCPVAKAFQDGKSHTAERQRTEPSGEITFWENTANPIRDAEGNIVSCVEVARDITERKKAEQALADEATRRHILIDQSLDGIVVLNEDAEVVEANQKFAEMLGYTPEEVRELHTWDWDKQYPPEKLLEMGRNVDEKGLHLETKHHRKDGSVIDVEISINAATVAGRKLIFCVSRDITERRRAEEALANEAIRHRILIDESSDGIVVLDEKGKVYETNKRFAEMLGYTPKEVRKLSVWDWEADFPREKVAEMIATIGPEGDHFETHHRRKDGTTYDVEISTNGAVVSGQKLIFCVCRDITARNKADEALTESSERLKALSEESPVIICNIDLEGNFLYVNKKFEEVTKYSRKEILGKNGFKLGVFRKELSPFLKERMQAKLKGDSPRPIEVKFICRDGELIWLSMMAEAIRENGVPVGLQIIAQDVTERRRMEKASRESEEKFSKAFRSSPNAMALTTLKDGRFLEVNDGFLRLNGLSREEAIGHTSKELGVWVNTKDRVRILRIMREKGKVVDEEYKSRTKSGEIRTMLFSAEPIEIAGERCMISSTTDITERKRMEEEIRQSEEKYRMIFESANDIIVFLDNKGNIIDVNPKISDIGGYTREQLLGKNFRTLTKIMPKKSVAVIAKNFMLRMLGVDVPPYEVEMYRGDGQKLNIEVSAVTVKDKDRVMGNLATLRDVTERHKAESALKYQRELIDQIIATTPNSVMVIDKEMRVLLANDTFYKHFGLKKSGVESKPISKVIRAKELEQALLGVIENNRKSLAFEFRYQLKDMPRIFIATIVKMQNNRYLMLLNDVTEEREKQESLYLTDRLASVGEMASGVAHELNNPLTSIIGLSSLMTKENNIPAEARADLTAINSEAQRCAAIIKNLLAFARKHTPRRESLQVTKVVEDVLKLRAYEHRSQNISVEAELPEDLPEVMADYFQLQQVFLNVILNAEAAMVDTGGGKLLITGEKTDGYVRISFSDNGPGIAKEHLGLIFNPFFTTKGVGKGTGLGLSICYGIIAAHGGRIYAKNNSDKGATFVVELPVVGN